MSEADLRDQTLPWSIHHPLSEAMQEQKHNAAQAEYDRSAALVRHRRPSNPPRQIPNCTTCRTIATQCLPQCSFLAIDSNIFSNREREQAHVPAHSRNLKLFTLIIPGGALGAGPESIRPWASGEMDSEFDAGASPRKDEWWERRKHPNYKLICPSAHRAARKRRHTSHLFENWTDERERSKQVRRSLRRWITSPRLRD